MVGSIMHQGGIAGGFHFLNLHFMKEGVNIGNINIEHPVEQIYYRVGNRNKIWALGRVILSNEDSGILVIMNSERQAFRIQGILDRYGYRGKVLPPSDRSDPRAATLAEFRDGDADLLLATDMTSRGSDMGDISILVFYDTPLSPDMYLDRVNSLFGNEGKGVVITFVSRDEVNLMDRIQRKTDSKVELKSIPSLPEGLKDRIREFMDPDEIADVFGMVRFCLELGERDGVNLYDMYNLIGKLTRCTDDAIGDIEIKEDRTFFKIHKSYADVFFRKDRLRFKTSTGSLKVVPCEE